jgi:tRNA 2-thiouridine synthesizing protein A
MLCLRGSHAATAALRSTKRAPPESLAMATVDFDARGMKCPLPVLKMNGLVLGKKVQAGDTLVVTADCPTFEKDMREWCAKAKKVLVVIKDIGNNAKRAEIRI